MGYLTGSLREGAVEESIDETEGERVKSFFSGFFRHGFAMPPPSQREAFFSPGLRESTRTCGCGGEGSALGRALYTLSPSLRSGALPRESRTTTWPEPHVFALLTRGNPAGRPYCHCEGDDRTPHTRVARTREPVEARGNLQNLNKGDSHVMPAAFLGMTKMRATTQGRPYK